MSQSIIGALRVNLGLDSAQFQSGLNQSSSAAARFRGRMGLTARALGVAFAGIVASVVSLRGALQRANEITALDQMARSVDGTVNGLRAVQMAASDAGVSSGELDGILRRMNRRLADAARGGGPARDALERLGLSAQDLMQMDLDERLAAIADRARELGLTSGQTARILMDFGSTSSRFALMIAEGGHSIEEARREVESFGLEISQGQAAAISAATTQISRLGLGFERLRNQLAVELVPALGEWAQGLSDSMREGGLLRKVIDGLARSLGVLVRATVLVVGGITSLFALADRTAGAFRELVAGLGEVTGVTRLLSAAFAAVSDVVSGAVSALNGIIGTIANVSSAMMGLEGYFIAAGLALSAYFLPAIASAGVSLAATYIPAVWGAVTATGAWIASLITLRGALIATGIGAMIVAAGMLINWLIKLVENTGSWGEALNLLGQVAEGVWDGIKIGAMALGPAVEAVWFGIQGTVLSAIASISESWGELLRDFGRGIQLVGRFSPSAAVRGLSSTVGSALTAWGSSESQFRTAASEAFKRQMERNRTAADLFADGLNRASDAVDGLRNLLGETNDTAVDTEAAIAAINGILDAPPGGGGGSGGGSGSESPFAQALRSLTEDMRELRLVAQEYSDIADSGMQVVNMAGYAEMRVRLLNAAMASGIPTTEALRERVHELALGYATAAQEAEMARARLEEMQGSAERGANAIANIFLALGQGSDAAKRAIAQLLQELARVQMMKAMLGLSGSGGLLGKLFSALGEALGPGAAPAGMGTAGAAATAGASLAAMSLPAAMPAMAVPMATPAAARPSGPMNLSINVNVAGARGNAEIETMVRRGVEQGAKEIRRAFPDMIKQYQADPRLRRSAI